MSVSEPVPTRDRIQSLDVLRGFALLGILLLNIVGFGSHSAAYFNPMIDGADTGINLLIWGSVDTLFEGSMRCLFSMLFGAGVVLFTTGERAKSAILHYRRNLWLLMFGLLDIFVLLWLGDILVAYAVAGAILYFVRSRSVRWLLSAGTILVLLLSVYYSLSGYGLRDLREASHRIESANEITRSQREVIQIWQDFKGDFAPEDPEQELSQRRGSYVEVFRYGLQKSGELFAFMIPIYMVPDALAMMLLGMGLFKAGVLSATRNDRFYIKIAVSGFALGLTINLYEVITFWLGSFDILIGFSYLRPSYHFGRLGMATGYLAVVMLCCRRGLFRGMRKRLASVGQMALTNYLSHSLICMMLFTGAGLAWVGTLERWMLYPIVLAIWVFQLLISPWWLDRFRFGPVEWLWRYLTYGSPPPLVRVSDAN